MTLAEQLAKQEAQERAAAARRAHPELEAKLDRFMAENPQLRERYNAMSKDELIRKLMFARMERAETAAARNRELEQWISNNPEIVAKVVQRIRNTPAENRERPLIKSATIAAANQTIRGPRIRP